jgi:hypothetical protein
MTLRIPEDGERAAFAEFVREDQPRCRRPAKRRAVSREHLLDGLGLTQDDLEEAER